MLNDTYKIFKSGTDIRGIASEGVADEPVNLTDDILWPRLPYLGRAYR